MKIYVKYYKGDTMLKLFAAYLKLIEFCISFYYLRGKDRVLYFLFAVSDSPGEKGTTKRDRISLFGRKAVFKISAIQVSFSLWLLHEDYHSYTKITTGQ